MHAQRRALPEETRCRFTGFVDILEQVCRRGSRKPIKQGIVHRDLKPDNIWLEPNGSAVIASKDARFWDREAGEVGNTPPDAAPLARTRTIHPHSPVGLGRWRQRLRGRF